MRPARVICHISADGADLLAGRVWRIVQPQRGDTIGEVKVQHPRLHPSNPSLRIHRDDFIHLGGGNDHRITNRRSPSRQSSPRPPSHKRPPMRRANPYNPRRFLGSPRKTDSQRSSAAINGSVLQVKIPLQQIHTHPLRPQHPPQLVYKLPSTRRPSMFRKPSSLRKLLSSSHSFNLRFLRAEQHVSRRWR